MEQRSLPGLKKSSRAAEFIGVIFILITTGIIYLFNVYVYKSAAKGRQSQKEVEVML
jgi:hypothetical protein